MLGKVIKYYCIADSRTLDPETFKKISDAIKGEKDKVETTYIPDYLYSLAPTSPNFDTNSIELLKLLVTHNRKVLQEGKKKDTNEEAIRTLLCIIVERTKIAEINPNTIRECIQLAEEKNFICLATTMREIYSPEAFKAHSALNMIFKIAQYCEKNNNWDDFHFALRSSSQVFKEYINTEYKGRRLLEYACLSGRSDIIMGLIDLGAECNLRSTINGRYPLHSLIESTEKSNNEEFAFLVKYIVSQYNAINEVDNDGNKPLFYASVDIMTKGYYKDLLKLEQSADTKNYMGTQLSRRSYSRSYTSTQPLGKEEKRHSGSPSESKTHGRYSWQSETQKEREATQDTEYDQEEADTLNTSEEPKPKSYAEAHLRRGDRKSTDQSSSQSYGRG